MALFIWPSLGTEAMAWRARHRLLLLRTLRCYAESKTMTPPSAPTNEELLPCPFCGAMGWLHYSGDGEVVNVRCENWLKGCMGAGANCYNDADAIEIEELKRMWFADYDPGETAYAEEFRAALKGERT